MSCGVSVRRTAAAKTGQVFVSSLRKALGDGLLVTGGRG
jgi:hypothetical protein